MTVIVLCSAFLLLSLSSIEMHKSSIAEYEWPNGTYWQGASTGVEAYGLSAKR